MPQQPVEAIDETPPVAATRHIRCCKFDVTTAAALTGFNSLASISQPECSRKRSRWFLARLQYNVYAYLAFWRFNSHVQQPFAVDMPSGLHQCLCGDKGGATESRGKDTLTRNRQGSSRLAPWRC